MVKVVHVSVTEDDIASFVKLKNDITHRGFKEVDESICVTAYVMIGLAYTMTLKRQGVSDDIIKDLMLRQLVG